MSINFQNVQDAIVALVTIAGIAVVLSGALFAAAALWRRGQTHQPAAISATPAQQPTQLDDARELVLR